MFRSSRPLFLALVAACGGQIEFDPPNQNTTTKQIGDQVPNPSAKVPPSSGTACHGVVDPLTATFDDDGRALGDMFTVSNSFAFSYETNAPIAGSASLKVTPDDKSLLTRKTNNACAVNLTFKIRASKETIDSGGVIARIEGGSRQFTIMIGEDGAIVMVETVLGAHSANTSHSAGAGLVADQTSTISLDVDFTSLKLTFGNEVSSMLYPDRATDSPPAVTAIELGTASEGAGGVMFTAPRGTYWLDDISIE
jgi:hypothetical protein